MDYTTMSVSEIFCLLDGEVFPAGSSPCCVFLWGIDQYLHQGEDEMQRRGFRRHARFVWDKCNGVAPAFTVRFAHEYLTWFYKPTLLPIDRCMRGRLTTVFREPARQHSRKPDCVYQAIAALYPDVVLVDVFSREWRTGWSQWGDQVGQFRADPIEGGRA